MLMCFPSWLKLIQRMLPIIFPLGVYVRAHLCVCVCVCERVLVARRDIL